jgi:hypothetical protein
MIASRPWFYVGTTVLNVIAVYACAIHLSPWLVYRCFAWVLPAIGWSTVEAPTDWYLRHLEIVTIVPALIIGYLAYAMARDLSPAATLWVWTVPAIVLVYRMLEFHTSHSVLIGSSMSALRYYFDITRVMPTRQNFLATDPVRVLAQEFVTAPFYAGVAYSLGAWLRRRGLRSHASVAK